MKEIWNNVPGHSRYSASNLGNIKSLNYKNTGKERILKLNVVTNGYMTVTLVDDYGKKKKHSVHRVILLSFDYRLCLQVNHKNGIKTDNRIVNLEWCTGSENMIHAYATGLQKSGSNSKLKESQVLEIRRKRSECKYTFKRLSIEYNVSESSIKGIIKRDTWKNVF